MKILNLTQHVSTPEQRAQSVIDLEGSARKQLQSLLTFETLPSREEVGQRARAIAILAAISAAKTGAKAAMVGGAPYLLSTLEKELVGVHIAPVYAFSVRESTEQAQPDGSVRKMQIFRHVGFVGMK